MDAVELLLRHSHLLGWNLRQAHTHERGRGRRPALILRPRLRPTDRSDEHESASDRGAENCTLHCRLLPRPVLSLDQFWRRHITVLPGGGSVVLRESPGTLRQWTGRMGRSQSKCSSLLQGQDPTSVIREQLAWHGVALSFPCNLATRARVTLSALFAPAPA